jgi:hypothetical protein
MNEAQRTLLLRLVHAYHPPSKAETLSPGTIAQFTHLQLALYEKLLLQLPISCALGHVGAGVPAADQTPAAAYVAKCSEKARNQRGYERRKATAAACARAHACKDATPPTAQNAQPAKSVTPPPAKGVTPPPAKGVTPPPAKSVTSPPAKGVTHPPAKVVIPPPAKVVTPPLAMSVTPPPAKGVNPPPAKGVNPPPAKGPDVPPRRAAPAVPQRHVNGRLIPLFALGPRGPRVKRTGPVIPRSGVKSPPLSPSVAGLRTLAQQAVPTTTDKPPQPRWPAPAVPQRHGNGRPMPLLALGSRGPRTGPIIPRGGVKPPPLSPSVAGLRTLAQQAVPTTTDKPPQPQRTAPAAPQRHDIGRLVPLAEKAAAPVPESPPPDLVHPAARRWQSGPLKPFVGWREIVEIPCRSCGQVFEVLRDRVYLADGEREWLDKKYWSLCPVCEEREDAYYAENDNPDEWESD